MRSLIGCWALTLAVHGCAQVRPQTPIIEALDEVVTLFDVATLIQDEWEELPLRGSTEYRVVSVDGRAAVRARGRDSASGLIRFIEADIRHCSRLSWSWRVNRLQADADLSVKDKDDVAASILLMFGDPGFLAEPVPVPTLRYVWSNDKLPEESVIDNPYMPGIVRSVVVRAGEQRLGEWLTETRDVLADFDRAFGHSPPDKLHAVVLFTDNDQTKQPVESYYEWIRLSCSS